MKRLHNRGWCASELKEALAPLITLGGMHNHARAGLWPL